MLDVVLIPLFIEFIMILLILFFDYKYSKLLFILTGTIIIYYFALIMLLKNEIINYNADITY